MNPNEIRPLRTREAWLALAEAGVAFAAAISLSFLGAAVYLVPDLVAGMQPDEVVVRLPQLMWIQSAVFVLVAVVMIRWRLAAGSTPAAGWVKTTTYGLLAALAAFGGSYAISTVQTWIGWEVKEQEWVLRMMEDPATLRAMLPVVILVGPIAEEAFFRGFVFRHLCRSIAPWAGYAVSAAMFAIVHFNPAGTLLYLWIATCLAYAYHRTGRMSTPVLGHVAFNSLVLWDLGAG